MSNMQTITTGRNDFRRWVLVIKDNKIIDRAIAANKYRVKRVVEHFEKKYSDVEGIGIGLCYLDEFDCGTNSFKVAM